jgi:hypothetical protein
LFKTAGLLIAVCSGLFEQYGSNDGSQKDSTKDMSERRFSGDPSFTDKHHSS